MTNIYTHWREGRLGSLEAIMRACEMRHGKGSRLHAELSRAFVCMSEDAQEALFSAVVDIAHDAERAGHAKPNAEREEAARQEGYETGMSDALADGSEARAEIEDAAADAAWHDAMEAMGEPAPAGSMAESARQSLALAGMLTGADREHALAEWRHRMKLTGM